MRRLALPLQVPRDPTLTSKAGSSGGAAAHRRHRSENPNMEIRTTDECGKGTTHQSYAVSHPGALKHRLHVKLDNKAD
jgi:hypothetical protein